MKVGCSRTLALTTIAKACSSCRRTLLPWALLLC